MLIFKKRILKSNFINIYSILSNLWVKDLGFVLDCWIRVCDLCCVCVCVVITHFIKITVNPCLGGAVKPVLLNGWWGAGAGGQAMVEMKEEKKENVTVLWKETGQSGWMESSVTRHMIPYFSDRLVLSPHRPQRSVPTWSHERQYPGVSFGHTDHRFSELHFPSTTASTQNHTPSAAWDAPGAPALTEAFRTRSEFSHWGGLISVREETRRNQRVPSWGDYLNYLFNDLLTNSCILFNIKRFIYLFITKLSIINCNSNFLFQLDFWLLVLQSIRTLVPVEGSGFQSGGSLCDVVTFSLEISSLCFISL